MATKKKAPTTKRPRKKSITLAEGRMPKRPIQALRAFTDAEWRHIESTVRPFDPTDMSETPLDHWTSYLDHDINIVGKWVKGKGWTAHAYAYPLVTKRGVTNPDTSREIDLGVVGLLSSGRRLFTVSITAPTNAIVIEAEDQDTAYSLALDQVYISVVAQS